MGYAQIGNVGRVIKRMMERDEGATLREIKDELKAKYPTVHTSSGPTNDEHMVLIAMDFAVHELVHAGAIVIKDPSQRQSKLFNEYMDYNDRHWKWDDDGTTEFDDVRWMPLQKRVPIVKHLRT